MTINKMI